VGGVDVTSAGGTGGSLPKNREGAGLQAPRGGTALRATLAMAQFMVVLDFTIVNVALPSIQRGLHVRTTTLQWLVSAYAVTFGGFLLLGGRLADLFGRARLYRFGCASFRVTPAVFLETPLALGFPQIGRSPEYAYLHSLRG